MPANRAGRSIVVLLYGVGQPVQRSHQVVGLPGAGAREPALVGELRPVVGVGHLRAAVVARLELPPPQVPERCGTGLGRPPRDPAALLELDDVVLPHLPLVSVIVNTSPTARTRWPGSADAEVVVAVPRRLPGRVGDQLEDRLGGGLDDPAGADNSLLVTHDPTVPSGADR